MASYRIGYLNPWSQAAENHACASLGIAARRLGHVVIPVTNSDEVLAADLDYVIAVASTQARTTHIPTFANIHEPRIRWWEDETYFWNLLTYDGYLTISDSLRNFVHGFCVGFGKDPAIGEFFSTPQRQQVRSDVRGLIERDALNLCYFGTNWDPRSRPLFRELARRRYIQIRGPEKSWKQIPPRAYFGSVPFDGQSVQTVYAANGAGLVVHSRNHTLDDVVSNRIFEICSVGAVAVAPDMPWLRDRFGDTIYYFSPWSPADATARQIDEIMEEISTDPAGAAQRAEASRAIFEKRYSAEVMIDNSVRYFEAWKARTALQRAHGAAQPEIDVVVRVGGRPVHVIERAIRSIDAQTMGRFRVVIVRYKPLDLSEITGTPWRNISGFEIIDCPGGNRARTMSVGLGALRSPYFAALDDDDYWLPDHVAAMWRVLKDAPRDTGLAYCGLMEVDEDDYGEGDTAKPIDRRKVTSLTPARGDIWDIVGKFGTINFIAARTLVDGLDLADWRFTTAEDTLMICHMLERADVGFSWRATVCTAVHPNDRSNYNDQTLQRKEDVLEVFLRTGPRIEAIERKFAEAPSTTWGWLGTRLAEVFEAKSKLAFLDKGRLVLEEGMLSTSIHDRDDVILKEIEFGPATTSLVGESFFRPTETGRSLEIRPLMKPWAYAAVIDIRGALHDTDQQWVVAEFDELDGAFGIGLHDADGKDFYTRSETPRRSSPVELWLFVGEKDAVSELVIQNWGTFEGNKATLRKMWAVRRKSED